MTRSRHFENAIIAVILAALYYAAARIGFRLALGSPSETAVWPATGIALAAFLFLGDRVWPGIFIGAFLANLTAAGTFATSLGIAAGNTLEGAVGAYWVGRLAGGRKAFERARDVFTFTLVAAGASTAVSATLGVASLAIGGFADWNHCAGIWMTWWSGHAVGDILVAPLLVLWAERPVARLSFRQIPEGAALLVSLAVFGLTIFGGLMSLQPRNYPLEFLCFPLLIWVAFRFGPRESATAVFLLGAIVLIGTLHGFGPFVRIEASRSLLLLQSFLAVTAVMTMALAALVSERRKAEDQLAKLAGSDPVTGLANYRKLMEVLNSELIRSGRTGQPNALVMLDLDGLKRINDSHGHLVGTEALRRVAKVIRDCLRSIDTAARYGGDEFCLILIDTDLAGAKQVARRIADQVAADGGAPPVTVSVGLAVYPEDGDTAEALIAAADRALYKMKALHPGKARLPA